MQWSGVFGQREVVLIHEALRVVTEGPWITRREFGTRTGFQWGEMARLAADWPAVPVEPRNAGCVRASLLEVSLGIRFHQEERAAWLTGTSDEYEALLERLDALFPAVE